MFNGRPVPPLYCAGGCMRDLHDLEPEEWAGVNHLCLDCFEASELADAEDREDALYNESGRR